MDVIIDKAVKWVSSDYDSNPSRFLLEVAAWVLSMGSALLMAFTVPDVPLIIIYPVWMVACGIYAWAAFTRKSTSMLANASIMLIIDAIGLARLLAV